MSNKLQQGVSILYDMELNNYLMARTIAKLDDEIAALGHKKKIGKPTKKPTDFGGAFYTGVITVAVAIICAVIGAIYKFIVTGDFVMKIFEAIAGAINGAICGAIVGLVIAIIFCAVFKMILMSKAESEFKKDCKKYEKNLVVDQRRVNRELKQKDFLIKERDSLIKRKKDASLKLSKYYNTIGIDPQYRNLVPIGYMNEFARLGISRKLEGTDGLYYLVRNELRWDQLQCTLEDISQKIDTIIDKQRDIYTDVLQINRKCDKMVSFTVQLAKKTEKIMEQVVANTSIAAYNSERISREVAFQNFMLCY